MMLHGAVQCCACFCLKTGQNQPTSVIVRFIPYQFMQFDIKALRNEAAEQRQQTLHRKTQGFNLQELHKFSKLMLFKNIYPDYLPLTNERKQRFHLTVFLVASINHHLFPNALRDSILHQFVT